MQEPDEAIPDVETIRQNLLEIRGRIEAACERSGRDPAQVGLIGVTKTKPAELLRRAALAGITDLGENYVQEMAAKHEELGAIARWHFIGHLQRNKTRAIIPFTAMLHSVDSMRLAEEINRQADVAGLRVPVLLQVNTSGEGSKFGVEPEAAANLGRVMAALPALQLKGLMTIAAPVDDPEQVRPMFRLLRTLRDSVADALGTELPHLSMGMTSDFEVAVEEGATLLRIGTALFGSRQ